jgi:ATP-dependent 26S proteasome regulatory subunit
MVRIRKYYGIGGGGNYLRKYIKISNELNTIMLGSLQNVLVLNLFSFFKTDSIVLDTLITGVLFSIAGYIITHIENVNIYNILTNFEHPWKRSYTVILRGDIYHKGPNYGYDSSVSNTFSHPVQALHRHITSNMDNNNTIFEIKALVVKLNSSSSSNEKSNYFVSQKSRFLIDERLAIYGHTNTEERNQGENKNVSTVETITICLTSAITPVHKIKTFLHEITKTYLEEVEESRLCKQFIYNIHDTKKREDDDHAFTRWSEHEFHTTRSFHNMFFERKTEIVSKVDFFLKNREWYYDKGIPYTLGIGLYGPPGTGKTSLIKCIAKHSGRHIVCLSFKMIKTRSQLNDAFYETRYNNQNKSGSFTFDKKILVIEDIDCLGDIVYKRKSSTIPIDIHDVVKTIVDKTSSNKQLVTVMPLVEDDLITLDDILNLWDGLLETPGRILVISSNHYDKLDPALTRPGRIDITLELSYVSRNTFAEMYMHLFGTKISAAELCLVPDKKYTPAEIMNIYISSGYDKHDFLRRICLAQPVSKDIGYDETNNIQEASHQVWKMAE